MRVLVNHTVAESKYLKALDYYLRQFGVTGVATTKTLTMSEASGYAERAGCNAILICHPATLANFVDDPNPTLTNWRGSRIDSRIRAIVIDSLANIYATTTGEFLLKKDLAKLKRIALPRAPFKFTALTHPDMFQDCLDNARKAIVIGADIETNQWMRKQRSKKVPCFDEETLDAAGLGETWITVVSFSFLMKDMTILNYVLPLVNGMIDYWTDDTDYAMAITLLREIMDAPPPKCFHNGLYDTFHLARYHAWARNWCLDSMGLSHSWYSELPKDLGFLSSWTLPDAYYWKYLADKEHKMKSGTQESYWEYAAKDTWAMVRSLCYLLKEAPAWVTDVNYARAFPMVYPCLYSAFEGIKINNTTRRRLLLAAEQDLEDARTDLQVMAADPDYNPGSHKQTSELLYDILGAARPPRAKSASATGAKERTAVAQQHPLLALYVDKLNIYQNKSKAISTYFQFIQMNSRLLWSLDPFGTETGRFASRSSTAWVGTQIQNQPYYAKEMYEPDEGYILFELDYSKAEAECTAHLSQCVPLITALSDKNRDFYKQLGVLFFQMKYEDVTTNFRNKVLKKIQHGTNYMMGANTFIDNLEDIGVMFYAADLLGKKITSTPREKDELTMQAFANELLASYHVPFPEVKQWWASLRDEVARTGMLTSPSGHRRIFFGDITKNHSVWRSAVAHQPQNTSVENLNAGYHRAYQFVSNLEDRSAIRLKTQIHDSIFGQVKIDRAAELLPQLAELVVARQTIHGRKMVINVDCEVSNTNWKDKIAWEIFSKTTLPTLVSQKSPTSIIDG